MERDFIEIQTQMEVYLKYENVCNGSAAKNAKIDYENMHNIALTKEYIPKAFKKLIDDNDITLIDLLSEKVADLCGFKPSLDDIKKYLQSQKSIISNLYSSEENSNENLKETILGNEFLELIKYYDNITIFNKTNGTSDSFRQIRFNNWPGSLHYEFMKSKNYFCIEFHIEKDGYSKLKKYIQEYHLKNINEHEIIYDPNWSKQRGRLRIKILSSEGIEKSAKCMLDFIKITKENIDKIIKNI